MKAYSLDLRKRIVDAYFNEEGSVRNLAIRFKVSFRFVWGLINRFRETGSLEPKPHGGGNPPRINEEGREILRQLVEQNSDATLEELCDLFEKECQIRPSRSSLHRTLVKLNITRKKKTFHAAEKDRVDVQQSRKEYLEKISEINPEDLVFVDEAGINTAMARNYARSEKGTRASASKPYKKGEHITVLGALSLEGIKGTMTIEGGIDGVVFLTYLKLILIPSLRAGNVVVMDNLTSHKVAGVQDIIESVGARLIYLPPYSPELSPIEEAWSKFKEALRSKAARTNEMLDIAVTYAIGLITSHDAEGWFKHCGYFACSTHK